MKLSIDAELCQGHLRCMDLAPQLFDADEFGHGVVLNGGRVLPEQERAALDAYRSCPERAISVDEDL